MHLVYIDDSRDEHLCVFSALAVPADEWRDAFAQVRQFRRNLHRTDAIFVYKEFHATEFVAGRGQIASRIVPKGRRARIFLDAMRLVAALPGARLFNAVFSTADDVRAFERLLNRVNRTMQAWDSRAVLIIDQGKETIYTRLARQMHVFNPIPSRFGVWPEGTATRNIPIERIIEDPFFKPSRKSYFIQLVDFCAYALLRRERPLPSKTRYGIHEVFAHLRPILVLEASRFDAEGIIRP